MTVWQNALAVMALRGGYNTSVVLVSTTILGMAAGLVGSLIYVRKRALISDALSHATLPGVCLGFLCGVGLGLPQRNLWLMSGGALITGLMGAAAVHVLTRITRLTEDTVTGCVLATFYGIGLVLLSLIQNMGIAGQAGLTSLLLGQAAALGTQDAVVIGGCALVCLILCLALFKEFLLVAFDETLAQVQGWARNTVDMILVGMAAVVTILGLQTIGLVLIIALLIIPAAAARFWTNDVRIMMGLAAGLGAVSCYGGTTLSAVYANVPTGAMIVVVAGGVFALSFLLAPRRGYIGQIWRQMCQTHRLKQKMRARPDA